VFYLLGFILTAYVQLPAVAVAGVGIVIAVMISQRDFELAHQPAYSSKNTGTMSQEEEEEDFFS
jgi:PTS system mannose-specific IIC component